MITPSVPSDLVVGHSVVFECRLPPTANFRTYKSLQFGFRVKGDSRLNRGFLSCFFLLKPIYSRRKMQGPGEFGRVHVSGVEHGRGSAKRVDAEAGGEKITMNPNAQHVMVDSNSVESNSVESSIPSIICPPITNVGKSTNIVWQECSVNKEERQKLLRQKGCVIWITGLSGSGKSTLACALSRVLHSRGRLTYILDGDNVRHGLNKNLSFSAEDRAENIRRIGEVARLFVDAGVICITSLISPYQRDRDACRALLPVGEFIEIFMDFPLEICEQRDAKGLYKLARAGKIKGFTGIDDPYEPPECCEIVMQPRNGVCPTPKEMAEQVVSYLEEKGLLKA
uniref:Adenylyl-sulfate kinase n=1 Tax=Picea sitchensis TaxID=3332 RepID=B8LQH4_PICSI|nr:unknown [Picea sitchensis]